MRRSSARARRFHLRRADGKRARPRSGGPCRGRDPGQVHRRGRGGPRPGRRRALAERAAAGRSCDGQRLRGDARRGAGPRAACQRARRVRGAGPRRHGRRDAEYGHQRRPWGWIGSTSWRCRCRAPTRIARRRQTSTRTSSTPGCRPTIPTSVDARRTSMTRSAARARTATATGRTSPARSAALPMASPSA